MIKASLSGAAQNIFEGLDTFLPDFRNFKINPLDLSFIGDFVADLDGLAFIKGKLNAGLEHGLNLILNQLNSFKLAGAAAFGVAEGAYHLSQKAFYAAQQVIWDLAEKKKAAIATVGAGIEAALGAAKGAVDMAVHELKLAIERRDFLWGPFDLAQQQLNKLDATRLQLEREGNVWNGGNLVPLIPINAALVTANTVMGSAKLAFDAAELAVNVAKAALELARKKYNELPTIQQVLSGGANAAAAAAKAALGLAITAWEEKKAELARVDLEIEGHKLTIKGLEAKWHFGAIIIRGKITAAQLALATAVTVAAGLRIVVDDLFNKVSECRVSLKLAIEGVSSGCDIAGAVELAGIKVAELAAQTALGAAELALAAPKAAFDLAVCAFAKIKAAFKLGVAFVTRCLYALTDAATFMLNGISGGIKVVGGVQ